MPPFSDTNALPPAFASPFFLLTFVTSIKLLFVRPTGYRSTDFEVHRNWLAITHSLPRDQWYYEAGSEWTLDYPPLFAYFEALLSKFCPDAAALDLSRHYYASEAFVYFHRLTVVLCDIVLFYGAVKVLDLAAETRSVKIFLGDRENYGGGVAGSTKGAGSTTSNGSTGPPPPHGGGGGGVARATSIIFPNTVKYLGAALVCLNPGLLIVDHMHFQYNGLLTGVLFFSAFFLMHPKHLVRQKFKFIRNGSFAHLLGAFFFCLVVNAKHIFVYVGPVYLLYLLCFECFDGCLGDFRKFSFAKFLRLGVLVVATTVALWMPVLVPIFGTNGTTLGQALNSTVIAGHFKQILGRMFPFGRGLTHAFWAPNVWALYSFADRVLAKILRRSVDGLSSTSGRAEVAEMVVLPQIEPPMCFLLTLAAYFYLFGLIFFAAPRIPNIISPDDTSPPSPSRREGAGEVSQNRAPAGGPAGGAPRSIVAYLDRRDFLFYLALGSAIAFSFGWHVHEKAILMVVLPLQLHVYFRLTKLAGKRLTGLARDVDEEDPPLKKATSKEPSTSDHDDASGGGSAVAAPHSSSIAMAFLRTYSLLACAGTLSVMPLIPETGFPFCALQKWVLALLLHTIEHRVILAIRFDWRETLALLAMFSTIVIRDLQLRPARFEFLPLMLISVVHAVVVLVCFARMLWLYILLRRAEAAEAGATAASLANKKVE